MSHIPGPAIASRTGFWRLRDVRRESGHLTHIESHQQYGPLVRTGPNHIPLVTRRLYESHVARKVRHSVPNEAYHRDQMRLVASAYSMSSLLEMEDAVDSCSGLLTKRLDEFATAGNCFDLGLQYHAFDVVGELTFDEKLGFLEHGIDVDGMMETMAGIFGYSIQCGQVSYMHKFLLGNPLILFLILSMESWNQVLNFILKAINSRGTPNRNGELTTTEKGKVAEDQPSKWIAAKESNPTRFSTRDIVVHTSANVSAGSDTTAIALHAIFYNLVRNTSTMDNYKEFTAHFVGLLLERHVPPGGVEICNQHIPAGRIVGVNAWVMHRDPFVFPEPEKFLPERRIESGAERLKEMEASFFAVGTGSKDVYWEKLQLGGCGYD
ncbi:hypothetical protein HO133_001146 [Letharia lupina]|uniref:Uncharacterized protein n=1 Tax=Letharia lupina TaxID=560253 RepID=A0A8H6CED6_9LECA|nr:uncharacterized protein HO133_001146 [Letharia lupina]KAF6222060.1 hypothetical protein HO133_001146 [Letharia lupina]